MSNTPKPQAKRVDPKLKSEILNKILLPYASIPRIAEEYDLSSATLYSWRMNHLKNNQEIKNNFIELVEQDLVKEDSLIKTSSASSTHKANNLSKISLIFNNISLSLKGNISTSSLTRILAILEEESCSI